MGRYRVIPNVFETHPTAYLLVPTLVAMSYIWPLEVQSQHWILDCPVHFLGVPKTHPWEMLNTDVCLTPSKPQLRRPPATGDQPARIPAWGQGPAHLLSQIWGALMLPMTCSCYRRWWCCPLSYDDIVRALIHEIGFLALVSFSA